MRVSLLLFISALVLGAQSPEVYSSDGKFLGNLNANRSDPNSVANPYGRYGSRHSPDSVNNPHGRYGSRHSTEGASNRYGRGSTERGNRKN